MTTHFHTMNEVAESGMRAYYSGSVQLVWSPEDRRVFLELEYGEANIPEEITNVSIDVTDDLIALGTAPPTDWVYELCDCAECAAQREAASAKFGTGRGLLGAGG